MVALDGFLDDQERSIHRHVLLGPRHCPPEDIGSVLDIKEHDLTVFVTNRS